MRMGSDSPEQLHTRGTQEERPQVAFDIHLFQSHLELNSLCDQRPVSSTEVAFVMARKALKSYGQSVGSLHRGCMRRLHRNTRLANNSSQNAEYKH
jgi:hypothetical protein